MASESGSGSHNNPFRRRIGSSAVTVPTGAGPAPPSSSMTPILDPAEVLGPQPPLLLRANDFAKALEFLPKTNAPPPSTTFQKKKPVKKVRVQSPPPSSPESAGAERSYPKYPLPPRDDDESSSLGSESVQGEKEDPFQNAAPPIPLHLLASLNSAQPSPAQPPPPHSGRAPPPNPFHKTLEDMEQSSARQSSARAGGHVPVEHTWPAGRTGLDVDAFRRLLLTGQGPAAADAAAMPSSAPVHPPAVASGDGGSMTDSSSISPQSIFDAAHARQETPRTSHDISEPEPYNGDEEKRRLLFTRQPKQPSNRKKAPPPPPPATRHGKLIKVELKDNKDDQPPSLERRASGGATGSSPTPVGKSCLASPTDVLNKPLPMAPPPVRSEHYVKESILDSDAAGKASEEGLDADVGVVLPPRPPTPPNASHSASTHVQSPTWTPRKPVPPPRRGSHARFDSKGQLPASDDPGTPPRSSFESSRSRSSSLRLSMVAPTPPPPRRPASHHRSSPSISSPGLDNKQKSSFPLVLGPISPKSDDSSFMQGPSYANNDASSSTTGSSTSLYSPQAAGSANLSFQQPPPPQRNPSLRIHKSDRFSPKRPGSLGLHELSVRKLGREGDVQQPPLPPPPPPRMRGSSKGSMEAPSVGSSRGSIDSVRKASDGTGAIVSAVATTVAPVAEEPDAAGGVDGSGSDEALKAVLADLDRLQREVDAARAATTTTTMDGSGG